MLGALRRDERHERPVLPASGARVRADRRLSLLLASRHHHVRGVDRKPLGELHRGQAALFRRAPPVPFLFSARPATIPYAESSENLSETFSEVKPHCFAAVPRETMRLDL